MILMEEKHVKDIDAILSTTGIPVVNFNKGEKSPYMPGLYFVRVLDEDGGFIQCVPPQREYFIYAG